MDLRWGPRAAPPAPLLERAREGGPAPIQEIRADLRKFMFMAFFLVLEMVGEAHWLGLAKELWDEPAALEESLGKKDFPRAAGSNGRTGTRGKGRRNRVRMSDRLHYRAFFIFCALAIAIAIIVARGQVRDHDCIRDCDNDSDCERGDEEREEGVLGEGYGFG